MRIDEIAVDEKIAWKRRGNKVVKQFRCTSGQRKGRVVDAVPGVIIAAATAALIVAIVVIIAGLVTGVGPKLDRPEIVADG